MVTCPSVGNDPASTVSTSSPPSSSVGLVSPVTTVPAGMTTVGTRSPIRPPPPPPPSGEVKLAVVAAVNTGAVSTPLVNENASSENAKPAENITVPIKSMSASKLTKAPSSGAESTLKLSPNSMVPEYVVTRSPPTSSVILLNSKAANSTSDSVSVVPSDTSTETLNAWDPVMSSMVPPNEYVTSPASSCRGSRFS